MKKILTPCLIAYALSININSHCMLKHTLQIKQYYRTYCTKKPFFRLGRTNIFNFPEYHHGLSQDLYDRNINTIRELKECILKLHHQNNIVISHVFHEQPLAMKTLISLEQKLQDKLGEPKNE